MDNLKDIFKNKPQSIKPPAYQWQDFALKIIDELKVPSFKRNSVFKICKDFPKEIVERAMNDTKELCTDGECWKYFFKVIGNLDQKKEPPEDGKEKKQGSLL